MLDSTMPYLLGRQRTHAQPDLRLEGALCNVRMRNRTFDSRGRSDGPNVSDAKIQGGALTVFYGTLLYVFMRCIFQK